MPTFDELATFVKEQTGFRGPLAAVTSLQELDVYGDDMDELLINYAKLFGVDLTGYLWYFHTGEEGLNIGALFFPPPNAKVREIPITLGMLHDFAQKGRWAVNYPVHEAPRSRPDIRVSQLLVIGFICVLVVIAVRGCVS
jgi:hypothetical protein